MNKIKSISFLLILFTAFSLAQEELKISDAVKITLENNLDIKIIENRTKISKNNASIMNSGYLPTLRSNAGINKSEQDIEIETPNNISGKLDEMKSENSFSTVTVNYTLFDNTGRNFNYQKSKELLNKSKLEVKEVIENTLLQLFTVYYGVCRLIEEKEIILNKFLKNDFKILVSTTIIEVGIDFPNANVIIIENANKFGLSQLHQLRGRVGRGVKESTCILMFKSNLSENAKKRINILKQSNDGFLISEEDMRIRGFGDILGFKQSGIKNFKLADPIHNNDLFLLAEKEIKRIENSNEDIKKFKPLIKLYDRADIINDIA